MIAGPEELSVLIPELIKRAVAGELHFNFIQSTISVADANSLSSLKGQAHSEPARGHFHFHFLPRAVFTEEQRAKLQEDGERQFHLAGTERGSASWTGRASALRIIEGMQGPAVHAHVPVWSREDTRSVHASFSRIVIAGRYGYPVLPEQSAAQQARTASVNCQGIKIDFRDYGSYTEICASSGIRFPEHLADAIVHALGGMLDCAVAWVYREQHADGRRQISVRPTAPAAVQANALTPDAVDDYKGFWSDYARRLAQQI